MKSKLFKLFQGRDVNVIVRDIQGSQRIEDTTVQGNVIIEGTLIDEDDEFYYLARSVDDEIDEALRKVEVLRFSIPRIEDLLNFDGEEGTSH